MSVNFHVANCQETRREALFGLCDDNNGARAYTDVTNPKTWIGIVKNDQQKEIVFTAVDKCLLHDHEYPNRGRCDALLHTDEHLYFVELKDQSKNWINDAINQLESTIQFYMEGNDISAFKHKKAFACNKRHKRFQEIDNELNLRFFRRYNVRIDIQGDIMII